MGKVLDLISGFIVGGCSFAVCFAVGNAALPTAFAGGFETTTVHPSEGGYVYNPLTGRGEVDLDKAVGYCKGQEITVTISADRAVTSASCKFPSTSYDHVTQLPVMGQKQFAVFWSR